jgi:hypothetical protein
MKIEILGFAGCPNLASALESTRAALAASGLQADIHEVNIQSHQAIQKQFLGSPSIRINGLDVELAARTATSFGFGCRTYSIGGVRQGAPPKQWIEAAIREAQRSVETS